MKRRRRWLTDGDYVDGGDGGDDGADGDDGNDDDDDGDDDDDDVHDDDGDDGAHGWICGAGKGEMHADQLEMGGHSGGGSSPEEFWRRCCCWCYSRHARKYALRLATSSQLREAVKALSWRQSGLDLGVFSDVLGLLSGGILTQMLLLMLLPSCT